MRFAAMLATLALGCECVSPGIPGTDRVLVEVESPVHARLVARTAVVLGAVGVAPHAPILIPVAGIASEVHYALGDPPRRAVLVAPDVAIDDPTALTLSPDASGERFALRQGSGPWRLFYLVADEAIADSESPSALDWSRIPSFEARAPALYVHYPNPVFEAVRAEQSERAAGRLLADTVTQPAPEWVSQYRSLSEDARVAARDALRAAIASSDSAVALERAVAVLELAEWRLPEARVRELVTSEALSFAAPTALLASRDEPYAPALACEALGAAEESWEMLVNVELALAAGTHCRNLDRFIESSLCMLEPGECASIDALWVELADALTSVRAMSSMEVAYRVACATHRLSDAQMYSLSRLDYESGDDAPIELREQACRASGDIMTFEGARYRIDDQARRIVPLAAPEQTE